MDSFSEFVGSPHYTIDLFGPSLLTLYLHTWRGDNSETGGSVPFAPLLPFTGRGKMGQKEPILLSHLRLDLVDGFGDQRDKELESDR